MAHLVKCSICGVQFDRDRVQAVKTGARRYAHASCDPNNTDLVPLVIKEEEDEDLKKLKDYIANKYGDKANWALINKQIKKFYTDNKFSYSGMLKSLVYFYDVQHNSIDKSNGGIGIIEYTYQAAYQYYYSLFMIQSQNANKDIDNFTVKVKEVTIPLPHVITHKKFFNSHDEEGVFEE